MTTTLSGFPYAELRFNADGTVVDADERRAALALVRPEVTDLIVISHGWNNDMAEARRLYSNLAASLREELTDHPPQGYGDRNLAILGVLWPAKKFAESDLIPGGAASVGSSAEPTDIRRETDELAAFLDRSDASASLAAAKALVDDLETDPAARRKFAELVRDALGGPDSDADDASDQFFDQDGEKLMDRLARPVFVGGRPKGSLTTGGAASLGDLADRAMRAARNMLNLSTYYEMKGRAGQIGSTGVADLLADLRSADADLRIHLVGHSFGARVVSAAARAGSHPLPAASMSLLQAAFSHYSFAADWEAGKDGLFRSVLTGHRVTGPTLVTYTKNDRAVGVAYAIASRVAGQVAEDVGDAKDKYGGLGRNGALKTPEAESDTLLAVGSGSYSLQPGRVHNLLADEFVSDHGDVAGHEVARAVLSVIATT